VFQHDRRGIGGRLEAMISEINHFDAEPGGREPADPPAALLTPKQAAKLLGICDKSLWNATNRGEIPSVKIGRSVRYDPRDLSRWIAANKASGGKPATTGHADMV
jgi:excisionase family DNA binding protein